MHGWGMWLIASSDRYDVNELDVGGHFCLSGGIQPQPNTHDPDRVSPPPKAQATDEAAGDRAGENSVPAGALGTQCSWTGVGHLV